MSSPISEKHKVLGDYRLAVDRALMSSAKLAADIQAARKAQSAALAHAGDVAGIKWPDLPNTSAWPLQVDAVIAGAKA